MLHNEIKFEIIKDELTDMYGIRVSGSESWFVIPIIFKLDNNESITKQSALDIVDLFQNSHEYIGKSQIIGCDPFCATKDVLIVKIMQAVYDSIFYLKTYCKDGIALKSTPKGQIIYNIISEINIEFLIDNMQYCSIAEYERKVDRIKNMQKHFFDSASETYFKEKGTGNLKTS